MPRKRVAWLILAGWVGLAGAVTYLFTDPFLLVYTLTDGQTSMDGKWYCAWAGYGEVGTGVADGDLALGLRPARALRASDTHSSLVYSTSAFSDFVVDLEVRTVEQLRVRQRGPKSGSGPNTWEAAWLLWRVVDAGNFYYFILKTNGVEFGKLVGAAQYILATASNPKLKIGTWDRWTVRAVGNRFTISVNGSPVLDVNDSTFQSVRSDSTARTRTCSSTTLRSARRDRRGVRPVEPPRVLAPERRHVVRNAERHHGERGVPGGELDLALNTLHRCRDRPERPTLLDRRSAHLAEKLHDHLELLRARSGRPANGIEVEPDVIESQLLGSDAVLEEHAVEVGLPEQRAPELLERARIRTGARESGDRDLGARRRLVEGARKIP